MNSIPFTSLSHQCSFIRCSSKTKRTPVPETSSSTRSSPRKSLYRRAAEAMGLWKPIKTPSPSHTNNGRKLKKCSSLRIASSFTHVCLCAPVSFYNDALRTDDSRPRRSISRSRSRSSIFQRSRSLNAAALAGPRASVDHGRRAVFRGKSLTDDVLMRRFVLEEEAMMHVRRRNEVEIIRRRIAMRRGKLGPSRLSRMVMAGEEDQI